MKISSIALIVLVCLAFGQVRTNLCTNGKQASRLSLKEYMTEFSKGPCAPVVMLPGLLGSKLIAKIDCPVFRASDPATFAMCGWSKCSRESGSTLFNTPLPEYYVWVTDPLSPMSIISPKDSSTNCWAHLIKLTYEKKNGQAFLKKRPGLEILSKGDTDQTNNYNGSECGTNSIEELVKGVHGTDYYKAMISRLKLLGYISGLTLQAVPFDWRLSVGQDNASKNLGKVIKSLKDLTNKKVVIVAHSMGNLKTSYALWGMSQKEKDESVALYLALAPPYLGVPDTTGILVTGNSGISLSGWGINMAQWKASIGSFQAGFELSPYPTYGSQANQPWMKKILKRIEYEQGKSSDPVFSFLPPREEICYKTFDNKNCRSGLEVFDNYIEYQGKTYGNKDYRQWVAEYSFSEVGKEGWNSIDNRFEEVKNLGVPVAIVYTQVLQNTAQFKFKTDPRIKTSKNLYSDLSDYSNSFMRGDKTVPSTSAVTPGIKWAEDFANKVPGAKAVKLIDVCSTYNVKTTPWDAQLPTGERIMNKIEYQGVPCDCDRYKSTNCDHNGMLFLPNMLDYLTSAVQTQERANPSSRLNGMSESALLAFQSKCELLRTLNTGSLGTSVEPTSI